jgi:hypothetical protein
MTTFDLWLLLAVVCGIAATAACYDTAIRRAGAHLIGVLAAVVRAYAATDPVQAHVVAEAVYNGLMPLRWRRWLPWPVVGALLEQIAGLLVPPEATRDLPADGLVIRFAYDKAAVLPVGQGYEAQHGSLLGIVWHSTEHAPGQSFAAVCAYLRDALDKSVHYVIGPNGEIERILDPGPFVAWGAGECRWQGKPADFNARYVQIEIYHRVGQPYAPAQLAAAAALRRQLWADHPTMQPTAQYAHRWIAWPPGRRDDPTNLSDNFLRAWFAER